MNLGVLFQWKKIKTDIIDCKLLEERLLNWVPKILILIGIVETFSWNLYDMHDTIGKLDESGVYVHVYIYMYMCIHNIYVPSPLVQYMPTTIEPRLSTCMKHVKVTNASNSHHTRNILGHNRLEKSAHDMVQVLCWEARHVNPAANLWIKFAFRSTWGRLKTGPSADTQRIEGA